MDNNDDTRTQLEEDDKELFQFDKFISKKLNGAILITNFVEDELYYYKLAISDSRMEDHLMIERAFIAGENEGEYYECRSARGLYHKNKDRIQDLTEFWKIFYERRNNARNNKRVSR